MIKDHHNFLSPYPSHYQLKKNLGQEHLSCEPEFTERSIQGVSEFLSVLLHLLAYTSGYLIKVSAQY